MNSTVNATANTPSKSAFNLDPGMETYGIMILLVCYSIVCLVILSLNYLILRSFMTTRALLPRQRNFLSYLASIDLAVGVVSIPTFLYNLYHWPSYGFYIYEAFDCASGLATAFVLVALSIKILRATFRAPTRYAGHPRRRNFYLVMAGSVLMAGSAAALNVTSLMGYIPFSAFFFVAAGLTSASILVMAVTCVVVLVAIVCGKDRENDREEDKKFRNLVVISCPIYIFTWVLPYSFFTLNYFCGLCIPVPSLFFYVVRVILYCKSFLLPIIYFRTISMFYKVVRKILTQDCLGRPIKYRVQGRPFKY